MRLFYLCLNAHTYTSCYYTLLDMYSKLPFVDLESFLWGIIPNEPKCVPSLPMCTLFNVCQ